MPRAGQPTATVFSLPFALGLGLVLGGLLLVWVNGWGPAVGIPLEVVGAILLGVSIGANLRRRA